ncbi:MAG: amino acid-binding protein [Candidatus Hydrogenedentes bacterium]|nr:amino acid-binding protein [Candidatus Hydrogenedentota bacterium]
MAYSIAKAQVMVGGIEDRPGGLAEKLALLAEAGANLEFVLARRDVPGKGLLFVAPVEGAKQSKAAKQAGLLKSDSLQALRIEGPDKAGLGAKMTKALAEAGINLRGLSAMAINRRTVFYAAFDNKSDVAKGQRILAKALGGK